MKEQSPPLTRLDRQEPQVKHSSSGRSLVPCLSFYVCLVPLQSARGYIQASRPHTCASFALCLIAYFADAPSFFAGDDLGSVLMSCTDSMVTAHPLLSSPERVGMASRRRIYCNVFGYLTRCSLLLSVVKRTRPSLGFPTYSIAVALRVVRLNDHFVGLDRPMAEPSAIFCSRCLQIL